MFRLSFLSSGSGSLTETILHAIKNGVLENITPVSIISDKNSPSLKLASSFHIKSHIVDFTNSVSREQSSEKILEIFRAEKIDFSFMTFDRILSGEIISQYKNKLINMHPSLLPSFPGYNTLEKANEYGCKFIGATCHFIDEKVDHGPIINQAVLPFDSNEEIDTVNNKLFSLRQKLAIEALYAFSNALIKINDRNVFIENAMYNQYPFNPSLNIPTINTFLDNYGN